MQISQVVDVSGSQLEIQLYKQQKRQWAYKKAKQENGLMQSVVEQ
jgi:hypothetical protein